MGRDVEAAEAFRHGLAIDELVHGSSDLRVAIACLNLGSALKNRGQLSEAFRLSQRALDIQTEKLGPDHPISRQPGIIWPGFFSSTGSSVLPAPRSGTR
jgi:Tetratricopeptide repeat